MSESNKGTIAFNSTVALFALIGLGFILELKWFLLVLWLDAHTTWLALRCKWKEQ